MASAGLKIVLPSNFTDTSLPVLRDDAILSTGSLVLLDVAHSATPATGFLLPAGAPINASVLYNAAYKECAAILGSGTAASLAGSFGVSGAINNGTKGKLERTALGGIHGIVSQATALAANDGATMNIASAIRTYIAANPNHSYYLSQWDRITRANTGTNAGALTIDTQGGGTFANQLLYMRQDTGWSLAGAGSRNSPTLNTLGNRISNGAIAASSASTYSASGAQFGAIWGASGVNAGLLVSRNNNWPSFAFYRLYLEDLTVSGRSYATVDALDNSLWTAAFAAGGRYASDTITTAVSTIP